VVFLSFLWVIEEGWVDLNWFGVFLGFVWSFMFFRSFIEIFVGFFCCRFFFFFQFLCNLKIITLSWEDP
jgi:hypothetical protein